MPTNYTPNYRLNQWERSDKILMEDFNADNAKIDAALKAEADARKAAVSAEESARKAADAAEVKAREALEAKAARLGNCWIWTATYTGTGTCGRDNPSSFTFPKKPLLALITANGSGDVAWLLPVDGWFATPSLNYLNWSGSTATWATSASNPTPIQQLNYAGGVYTVIALMPMDN